MPLRPPVDDDHRHDRTGIGRRQLLRGLSGAALAGASSSGAAAAVGSHEEPEVETPQYRETEHIRQFYALARR
jgi:hypothetical protein